MRSKTASDYIGPDTARRNVLNAARALVRTGKIEEARAAYIKLGLDAKEIELTIWANA